MSESEYDLTRVSRPVVILPYQERWVDEFQATGSHLRKALSECALRIDHIGSTSVLGLGAKDIIDIQITVEDLDCMEMFTERMQEYGYIARPGVGHDNFVGVEGGDTAEWRKRNFREAPGERRTHIHVRENGRLNQKYALLFRDFLRASETVRSGYEITKRRLAEIFPECIDGYLYIKDPFMDVVFEAARLWASQTNWEPDNDHL